MKVCHFGIYNPQYPRNAIIKKSLQLHGIEVVECTDRGRGIGKYVRLFLRHRSLANDYDVLLVGFPGQSVAPFAKLFVRKPIIVDAFLSLYDTNVYDRNRAKPGTILAWYWKMLDSISARSGRVILVDTDAHADYLHRLTGVERSRFKTLYAGCDDAEFYPLSAAVAPKEFIAHFHGYLVPFHGIEVILEAACILRNEKVQFRIVTRMNAAGKAARTAAQDVGNITWVEETDRAKLNRLLNSASVVLGVFGATPKLQRVIPNKIYESLAAKRPVITARSPAVQELLTHEKDCLLINPCMPEELAQAIRRLRDNPQYAEQIAEQGYRTFQMSATPQVLGKRLREIMQAL